MKLKLDDKGAVVVQDGKPVYTNDEGKEIAFDVVATVGTIKRLNAEAQTNRERAEALETKLKPYEGLDDPVAARKALDIVKNLDAKKLVDAGEVEKVKEEVTKAVKAQYEPVIAERDQLKGELYSEKIGGAFTRSKVIAEKFQIPADLVQARFEKQFKIEEGKVVAYDANGNKLYSPARPGELANFDEALELIVDAYPYKGQILKGSGASGGGTSSTPSAPNAGRKTITRDAFFQLPVAQQPQAAKDYTIVDS